MMIICSLVKIITIHTYTSKKKDQANANNYCQVLIQHIHYIPNVHTIMDYRDVYTIYHSSSSYRAIGMDIPDSSSPPLPIIHRFRQVLRATTRILTGKNKKTKSMQRSVVDLNAILRTCAVVNQ